MNSLWNQHALCIPKAEYDHPMWLAGVTKRSAARQQVAVLLATTMAGGP